MKFFRPGYWQKLVLFLIFLVQLLAVVALLIWLIDLAGSQGYGFMLAFVAVAFIADLLTAIFIFSTPSPDVYKLSWLFAVFAIPVGGVLMYVFFANKQANYRQRQKLRKYREPIEHEPSPEEAVEALKNTSMEAYRISSYLEAKAHGGVHQNTSVRFFPLVDDAFEPILEELRKAEHFIYLEFFIVAPGVFWDSMLEILKEKAADGVDVRFIYDDVGSLTTAPIGYAQTLTKMGVKTICFNPFRPMIDIRMNNRDHRKILIIDGHTCFSGGFNLADEYINKLERFGHWKDNAILLKGEAVLNFTNMFLATWTTASAQTEKKLDRTVRAITHHKMDFLAPSVYIDEVGGFPESDGFVQPYGDLPFDNEAVGERVYIDMINAATDHLYIVTPYLIIDKEVENAISHAALRGVDVRLLTPHIPDKPAVFNLTRMSYGPLIKSGVHVYEYTPGFVHEKTFICDGKMATVGTINLDYRSLYLHLECGTFMVGCSCIQDMEKDFLETIGISEEISLPRWKHWRDRQYWYWTVLRIIAPFL